MVGSGHVDGDFWDAGNVLFLDLMVNAWIFSF